jgi:hypothetical protein
MKERERRYSFVLTQTPHETTKKITYIHIHTYYSSFIPEGVAEVSQIFLRDTHVSPKLVSYEEH